MTEETIQDYIDKARAVKVNMEGMDWSWQNYKIDAHEKDVVLAALNLYIAKLEQTKAILTKGEYKNDDSTELCR